MRLPIGIFADPHLFEHKPFAKVRGGYNSRLMDTVEAIEEIATAVKKAGGKTLICAGDWFHHRNTISTHVLFQSAELLNRLKKIGISVMLVPGNHDYSLDGLSRSVSGQPFACVWSSPGMYECDGWKIGVIPWTDTEAEVDEIMKCRADFYVGHFGVAGSTTGPSDYELQGHISLSSLERKSPNSPVFLGHYHKPQDLGGKACYVGSVTQHNWGEAGEAKRWILLRADGSQKSIPLDKYPRFMRVTPEELGRCRKNDFVSVATSKADEKRVRNIVKNQMPDAQVVPIAEERDDKPRVNISGMNATEQLKAWLKHEPAPEGVQRSEMISTAQTLLGEST